MSARFSARPVSCLFYLLTIAALSPAPAVAQTHRPHAGMMRFPDVSATHIVFCYAGDLWLAPRDGGTATPLASPPGAELLPRFSPDGAHIAFVGNYEGNRDLYVIPTTGGVSRRVTYHPATEQMCEWSPDGRLIYMTNGFAGLARQQQLWITSSDGGLPEKLPVPYGTDGAISPDGAWLAYMPNTIDWRTWKRYRGGMQSDIWLFNLKTNESKRVTDWEGKDTLPMWHGKTLYYLSDAGDNHRLNIWAYDTATGRKRQITNLADYDIKWPSIGPGPKGDGEIVFQYGRELRLLDLKAGESRPVQITIPGDRPRLRAKHVDSGDFVQSWNISSTGKRAVIGARGDIWTLPAKEGSPRRLTRTSGAAERDGLWSPDGKSIAYLSDATGEYELYVAPAGGRSEPRQITRDGSCFRYLSGWSPDSKHIVFTDKTGAIYLCTVESGDVKHIDTDPWTDEIRPSWSRDSRRIAYARGLENRHSTIWVYDVQSGEKHQLTSGMFNDTAPCFDRDGDFLYFASNRDFSSPIYEDTGTTWVYANTDRLYAVPLRRDVESPLAPKSDEEGDDEKKDKDKDDKNDNDKDADKDKKEDSGDKQSDKQDSDNAGDDNNDDEKGSDKKEPKPVTIDFDGFEARAIELPVKRGNFTGLSVNDKGHLIYARRTARGSGDKPAIKIIDLKDDKADKKEEKTVADDASDFAISDDGKKLLIRKDGKKFFIVDAAADQKLDKPVPTAGLGVSVDPREEWRQIFDEAWRLHRDFFYVKNLHGVDWPAIKKQYAAMLEDCSSRDDLTYIIGEMISELNVGHAYVRGLGDTEDEPSVSVGMLGCDFNLENGAYRIAKIYEGAPWDLDARSPLRCPGREVKEGEYLLAVNGTPVDAAKDPWAAFQDAADRAVTLTLSDKPALDDAARDVVVKTLTSESNLRYRAWIEANRKYVADRTEDRVGYIYVPNTGTDGQNDLFRQFQGQRHKAALIIDERWNGGGQIPTRFIELLNRPVTNYWARRDGIDWTWPPDSHQGPKCMLINGMAGSGGDMFPWLFRHNKLGKLIGTRTWGGLVGISGNPGFIDGGSTNVPTFGFYETDGTWGVEGHGVDPDIEVLDDPAKMVDGKDPQLDAAIALMLEEIKRNPYAPPKRPADPDRRGMGLPEADR